MIIKSGCATLRAMEEKDMELLMELMNDPDLEANTIGWHLPISSYEQKIWMENYKNSEKEIRFMIELSNGVTIGMIVLHNIDWKNRVARIGIKTKVSEINKLPNDSYDATYGVIKYAFEELNLQCLEIRILEYNKSSLRLAERLGFVQEGILRDRYYKKGQYHSAVMLSLLKKDF